MTQECAASEERDQSKSAKTKDEVLTIFSLSTPKSENDDIKLSIG